jgi:hypothetical protein
MRDYVIALQEQVTAAAAHLLDYDEERAGRPLAPGKWSPKQVLGHMIDSASNNHQRFVRAQTQEALVFPGYDQDDWVALQRYQEAPWPRLVALWESFNLHIAQVMDAVPDDVALRARTEHALDRIAWETVPADEPATLDYFMRDYLAHLRHHLRQIDPELAPLPTRQRRG